MSESRGLAPREPRAGGVGAPGAASPALGPGAARPRRGLRFPGARWDRAGGRAASRESGFLAAFAGGWTWGCDHPVLPPSPWKKTYLPWCTPDPIYTYLKRNKF